MTHRYVCEVCESAETLTEDEAYEAGWDYPPFMGAWGIVSPRTCGECGIMDTAWFALAVDGIPVAELDERHKRTIVRILAEENPDEAQA